MFFCGRNVRWEAKKRPFWAHFGSVQNQNSVTVSTEMAFFADFSSGGWPFPREKQMSFPKLPTKKTFFFSNFFAQWPFVRHRFLTEMFRSRQF